MSLAQPPAKPQASASASHLEPKPVAVALQALVAATEELLRRHPLGYLAAGPTQLEFTVKLPLGASGTASSGTASPGWVAAVAETEAQLAAEIDSLLAHRAVFQPGRVLCYRCAAASCEHAAPTTSRQIFAGYGPSGVPRFVDWGQFLLERQDPRVDALYERPLRLVTAVLSGRELTTELLDAFRHEKTGYQIHGQVLAGWFAVEAPGGREHPLALSFQVISTAGRAGRRRLGLNLLGVGPEGEPLPELYHRLESLPWPPVLHWAQSVLTSIERAQGSKKASPEVLSSRIQGLLAGMARRLEQRRRARELRTEHAEARHHANERPTRMALQDLAQASREDVLYDVRRKTLIVLGERGRAHVFNLQGKLVTSIRYSPESIARKREQTIWRPAKGEEMTALEPLIRRAR